MHFFQVFLDGLYAPAGRRDGGQHIDTQLDADKRERVLGPVLVRIVSHDGNDGQARRNRKMGEAFLQWQQSSVAAAGPFRPDPDAELVAKHQGCGLL